MDDPSNWELARRLDQIYGSLQALVGRGEYAEYQRSIERQIADLHRIAEDERRARVDADEALHQRITAEAKTAQAHYQFRSMFWVGLCAVLATVCGILVSIWLAKGR